MKDHYETLGVSPRSEIEVIQAAYKALMRKYHPDQNDSDAHGLRAREINEAFAVLGDEAGRREYDRMRQMDMFARTPSRPHYATPPPPAHEAAPALRRGAIPGWIWAGVAFGATLGLVSLAPLAERAWSANLPASLAEYGPMALVASHSAVSDAAMAGASALSADLQCAQAPSPVDQRVCGNPELAAREVELARLYDDLQERLRWRQRAALRESQDSWMSGRDLCKSDSCIAQAYDRRIAQLSALDVPSPLALRHAVSTGFDCDLAMSWAQEAVCQDPLLAAKDVKVTRLHDRLGQPGGLVARARRLFDHLLPHENI
jgi:uncharacterized protein